MKSRGAAHIARVGSIASTADLTKEPEKGQGSKATAVPAEAEPQVQQQDGDNGTFGSEVLSPHLSVPRHCDFENAQTLAFFLWHNQRTLRFFSEIFWRFSAKPAAKLAICTWRFRENRMGGFRKGGFSNNRFVLKPPIRDFQDLKHSSFSAVATFGTLSRVSKPLVLFVCMLFCFFSGSACFWSVCPFFVGDFWGLAERQHPFLWVILLSLLQKQRKEDQGRRVTSSDWYMTWAPPKREEPILHMVVEHSIPFVAKPLRPA